MASTDVIQGSWFPSGYHGHFRSKVRLDFMNEFRHLSKPHPPTTFSSRLSRKVTDHVFSKHDNRNSFTTDALYFEQGLGKRRFRNNSNKWQPDFLAWSGKYPPGKEMQPRPPSGKHSTYELDFRGKSSQPMKSQYTPRQKTSFDEGLPVTTTYRYSHGLDNPSKTKLNVMSNAGLSQPTNRKIRASSARFASRDTVASCMSWYRPSTPQRAPPTACNAPGMVPQPPPPKTAPASVEPAALE